MAEQTAGTSKNTRLRMIGIVILLVFIGIATAVYVVLDRLDQDPIPLGAPSGELAFMSDRNGNWDIFLMDATGTITNLTEAAGEVGDADYFPSWAFQSDMINFLTNRDGELGAGQVQPDGEALGTLSVTEAILSTINSGRFDWDPLWSAGGETLLWASLRDFNLEIYTMLGNDFDTMNRLTQDGFNGPRDWFMAWSPDGEKIVFSSDRNGDEDIYVMNADGSDVVQLTDSEGDDTRPAFSEDGTQILFVSERNIPLEDGMDLYIMNADGSDQRPLGDEIFTGWLVYSADGSEVLYISNEEGDFNIYRRDADGENVRRLTESDSDDLFPVWRPTVLADEAEAIDDTTEDDSDG